MFEKFKYYRQLKQREKDLMSEIISTAHKLREHEDDDDINRYRELMDVYCDLLKEQMTIRQALKHFEWI